MNGWWPVLIGVTGVLAGCGSTVVISVNPDGYGAYDEGYYYGDYYGCDYGYDYYTDYYGPYDYGDYYDGYDYYEGGDYEEYSDYYPYDDGYWDEAVMDSYDDPGYGDGEEKRGDT